MKRRLSPQEKKQLSLKKDRRNAYGESDKGSRKTIPRRKATANRIVRRKDKALLSMDPEAANASLKKELKSRWRKVPDKPLKEVLDRASDRKLEIKNRK